IAGNNVLDLLMVCHDLSTEEVKKIWQPFLDWVARSPAAYTVQGQPILGSMPAQALLGRGVEYVAVMEWCLSMGSKLLVPSGC
ncbi:MAG: hypothetical protein ABSE28_24420, partial [Candidatus Sulfotelmatobacter sp.]